MNYSLSLRIFVACLLLSLPAKSNDLTVMKYEYGMREWDGHKYDKGIVYSLPTYHTRYIISDIENINIKNNLNVTLDLSIKEEQRVILATVRFKNDGASSLFIPKRSFSSLSRNFLITTDNIMLKYLGGRFDYGGDFERDDWIEVPPKKMASFTQILNENYEFLPGKRLYNIGSLEYTVVNEGWFIDKSIYNKLISITI
ncbi:hypothetical protein [Klebsiella aerogenes]|uniref:hypothetical protein n=1 Tax=Klebsiella aerogenes TaxID=548 RepID=UPI0013D49493|nr:hypothetical protein [Klebsiella aerogenes]